MMARSHVRSWGFLAATLLAVGSMGSGCGQPDWGTIRVGLRPLAFTGGDFSVGATEVAAPDRCGPAQEEGDLAYFEAKARSRAGAEPVLYRFEAADIAADCSVAISVPPGEHWEIELEGYTADGTLIRKGFTNVTNVTSGENVEVTLVLWPARRIQDAADDAVTASVELTSVDVVRQHRRVLFVLNFARPVRPAPDGRPNSVDGFLYLESGVGTPYRVLLGTPERAGMTFENLEQPTVVRKVGFGFAGTELRVALPHAYVGGTSGITPDLRFAVYLEEAEGTFSDALPDAFADGNGFDTTELLSVR